MNNRGVVGIILAGGKGRRLWPLTDKRSKPAVPIAGKFRLIDIPISNCLHSDIKKIFVLTQFNSESLNRHVIQTYSMPPISAGFVQILAAQQTTGHTDWYQGSADAVRQNLTYLWDKSTRYYLILGGDHLYTMNYAKMIEYHARKKADITIGVHPIHTSQTHRFGVININHDGKIVNYAEKPREPEVIQKLEVDPEILKNLCIKTEHNLLGSMGIYVFSKKVLFDVLNSNNSADFGGGIFPEILFKGKYKTFAFPFNDYWEDIGTIETFFNAMIELTDRVPRFNFYDYRMPIFTHPRFLPGAKLNESHCYNSILCEGAIIDEANIDKSVIGIRSIIRKNSRLSRVVMMGADYYQAGEEYEQYIEENKEIGIGENCEIEDAIIDKNAYIGDNVKILKANRTREMVEHPSYVIKDGIVIIRKNVHIPKNTII